MYHAHNMMSIAFCMHAAANTPHYADLEGPLLSCRRRSGWTIGDQGTDLRRHVRFGLYRDDRARGVVAVHPRGPPHPIRLRMRVERALPRSAL
jgi:hypothetical protein